MRTENMGPGTEMLCPNLIAQVRDIIKADFGLMAALT